MFLKKKKKKVKDTDSIINKKRESSEVKIIERPRICLFDIDEKITAQIRQKGFNVISASLGPQVDIPNKKEYDKHFCLRNANIPPNLHECDIIVIDLENKEIVPYDFNSNWHKKVKMKSTMYFLSKFPQNIFDPRPVSAHLLYEDINNHLKKKSFLIIFASQKVDYEYTFASIENDGYHVRDNKTFSNYSFLSEIPIKAQRFGKELYVLNIRQDLKSLLEENLSKFYYEIVFFHPTEVSVKGRVNAENFFPLMKNNIDEIASYAEKREEGFVFVFPQIKEKDKILIPLLENIFPDLIAEVFPYSTRFLWKNHKDYWLPNHGTLIIKKTEIETEYKKKIEELEKEIAENAGRHSFLHDLITETDDNLVSAVKAYMEWLGFENVKKMDDVKTNIKEEDLQIEIEKGLLVVEVKGIGGTSKDSDCNQISKIKHRREKGRKKFDVFALYIVNHQRFLPPKKRSNPPFSENQIRDAENEERGLLTTWELFKLYTYIDEGIITKKEARGALLKFGLITFVPSNLCFLGEVSEIYQNGLIIILKLNDHKIKVGDKLIAFHGGMYTYAIIETIKINDNNVDEAEGCEVGIKTNIPIKRKSMIYLKE